MSEFIDFEVSIEDTNQNLEEEEDNEVSDNDSLKSFIDDERIEGDGTFCHRFENVTDSIDDVLKQEYDKSMGDIEKIDQSNFCETSEEETQLDEFKDSEKRIEKFKKTPFLVSLDNDVDQNDYNSFINAIFFAIRYDLEHKTELCSVYELKESIDNNLFVQSNQKKFDIVLDYQKFNSECHEINLLLAKYGYFLRVFELKDKFRHLTLKNPNKQSIVRQLSSCINEKYNGFHVVSIKYNKKLRKN